MNHRLAARLVPLRLTIALAALAAGPLAHAGAQEPLPATPAKVFDPMPALSAQGCAPRAVIIAGSQVAAICNGLEVWSFELTAGSGLVFVGARRPVSPPTQLTLREGAVWVSMERAPDMPLAALPFASATSTPQGSLAAPRALDPRMSGAVPSPPARVIQGEVVDVRRTSALVSIGRADGLLAGDRIAVPVKDDSDDTLDASLERLAIGRVVAVGERRASVEFGLGEQVLPGSRAETSLRAVTAELLAPPRFGGMLQLEGAIRPYLPVRKAGLGALGELAITYHAAVPFYFRAEVSPLGGRAGSGAARGAVGAFASVGWDHALFAVGVGAGVLQRRNYTQQTTREGGVTTTVEEAYDRTVPSFAVSQFVRVGALDGLHATLTNVLAVAESSDEWAFGYLLVRAQIPLSATAWLCPAAGGGRGAGFVLGELGARLLVHGNGRGGSLFLKPTLGIAGVGAYPAANYVAGPTVGLHAEYRLGPAVH
jgi:hypothetical protein